MRRPPGEPCPEGPMRTDRRPLRRPCSERSSALARCLEASPRRPLDCGAELRGLADCVDRSRLDKLSAEQPEARLPASRGFEGLALPPLPEPKAAPDPVSNPPPPPPVPLKSRSAVYTQKPVFLISGQSNTVENMYRV